MKDSEKLENDEYRKRTGDTTGDFASNSKMSRKGSAPKPDRKEDRSASKRGK